IEKYSVRQLVTDLRRCHRDHEQREDLSGEELVLQVGGEVHEVHVDSVQHQLDQHEHQYGVSPGQHAVDARREQHGGEEQRERQPDGVGGDHRASSLRAITTAPTSAANRSTETTSNGSTKLENTEAPT